MQEFDEFCTRICGRLIIHMKKNIARNKNIFKIVFKLNEVKLYKFEIIFKIRIVQYIL